MSNQAYNLKLGEAVNDLKELHQMENWPAEQNEKQLGMQYERKDEEWFAFYANLYIKYIECYRKLEDIYDQMLHPQKRHMIKKMLENTIVRMCEIKNDLIFYNTQYVASVRSDFVRLDELLLDLKLNDTALEVPIPRYFQTDQKAALQERDQIHQKLLSRPPGNGMPEEEVIQDNYSYDFNLETAIRIIQKNERGRQGIERALKAKKKWKAEQKKQERQRKIAEGHAVSDDYERDEAVLVIQKYYRGFISREKVEEIRDEELLFLGMKRVNEDPKDPKSEIYKYDLTRNRRKAMQDEYMNEYKRDLKKLKEEIKESDAPDMKEAMLEDRRKRIVEYMDLHEGKELPKNVEEIEKSDDVGPPPTPEQIAEEEEQKKKEEKAKKDAKKAAKGKKSKKETPEEEFMKNRVFKGPSEIVNQIQENIQSYAKDWESKPEDQKNFAQKHDSSVGKTLVQPLVEEEIRQVCNSMIQIELDNLRQKIGLKAPKKGKGGKKKKKKVKVEVPPNIEKLKEFAPVELLAELIDPAIGEKIFAPEVAEKSKKEMPGGKIEKVKDRPPVDHLAELTDIGVAKKLMPAQISDLIGNFSKLGVQQSREQSELLKLTVDPEKAKLMKDQILTEPDPSMGHIRQAVTELLAIPLGSAYAREKLPVNKTALFLGAPGTGKSLVVRALQTQCSAMIIDISPANLMRIKDKIMETSYRKKLFYMIWRVVREYQPCIVLVDEADYVFPGKKKPEEAKVASKIKRNLLDLKKFIKDQDRVLILGCMSRTECNRKEVKKFFDKTIYFPYPDYETRKMLFKYFIEQKGGVLRDTFPLSTLAHVSEGYTAGSFKLAVEKVLTQRRKEQLATRPLTLGEFVGALSNTYFCYRQEYAKLKDMNNEFTGMAERQKKMLEPPEETDPRKKGKGKGKGKAK